MHQPGTPPSESAPLPRTVAGFQLQREIGRGGMGVVYEAEEIASGRTVALKVLLSELSLSGQAFERFQREARLAASISHVHCVFVYGAHEIDGSPAIAMELVGGETLEDKIRRGEPIPIRTAVRWCLDLLDGLEAAHRAGVLHRDIKPSNCFVTADGRVKIGDFGLSRSIDRDVQLTQSGQFLGSPLYASPEQIKGRAFDARSDQYSCGATLYAILTGKPAYSGSNLGEVLARILSEAPPAPRSLRPEIPAALEHVVLRAMDRDPEKRFRDLQAFRMALMPFAAADGTAAKPLLRVGSYLVDIGVLAVVQMLLLVAIQAADLPFGNLDPHRGWLLESSWFRLLLAVMPIAYFALLEGLSGATLGKWLFGQRVLSVASGQPSLPQAVVRGLVFLGPGLVLIKLAETYATTQAAYTLWTLPSAILLPFLLCSSMRQRNGWRGLHELASRTRTVRTSTPFQRPRLSTPPPEAAIERSNGLPVEIGSYAVEGLLGCTANGRMVKARDATLERSVWIHLTDDPDAHADEARRNLARPSRLRWLGTVDVGASKSDVFESPGGTSLPVFAARHGRFEWPTALRMIATLVEETRSATSEAGQGALFSIEQVWIDRNWDLRLLDQPVGPAPFERHSPLDFISVTARALILGSRADGSVLPQDLPVHAEPFVRRLIGNGPRFRSFEELGLELASCQAKPTTLLRRTRGAQLAVNTILPALTIVGVAALGVVTYSMVRDTFGSRVIVRELRNDQVLEKGETRRSDRPPLTPDQRRAREILVVQAYSGPWAPAVEQQLEPEERAVIEAARARYPEPASAEIAWAKSSVDAEHGKTARSRGSPYGELTEHIAVVVGLFGILAWGLAASVSTFVFRGGWTLSVFGICVRNRRGEPASRLRCLARTTIQWLPAFLAASSVLALAWSGHPILASVVGGIAAAGQIAAFVHALLHPAESLVDRLLRMRLVPR